MEFYEVAAKCGHVGKDRYYKGMFYVMAESGSAAAAMVRMKPRVKHHHKDAILSVAKVGLTEFQEGQAAYNANPYFNCHSRQEQRLHENELSGCVYAETGFGKSGRRDDADRQAKLEAMRRFLRKMNKYGDYDLGA